MKFLAGIALTVLAASQASAAWAQASTQPAPAEQAADAALDEAGQGDIVVTGSRAIKNGEQAPTPLTVVSSEQLKSSAVSLADGLRLLPQMTGSGSPVAPNPTIGNGPSSQFTVNLRDLGANRTLTLLDGRRPAIFGGSGLVDTGVFPQLLIKRVDIVTGGASSAYGSDAVSGVVNYILDTDMVGLAIEGTNGISDAGDGHSYSGNLAVGVKFGGDRGHLVASISANGQDGVEGSARAFGRAGYATINNPLSSQAGQPALLFRPDATLNTATFGGRITTTGLTGWQFDAAGNPIPYRTGTDVTASLQSGGDGARYAQSLTARTRNWSAFGHAKYAVSDAVEIFAEASYGRAVSTNPNLTFFNLGSAGYKVYRDNPYITPALAALIAATPNLPTTTFGGVAVPYITVGKLDRNFGRNVTFFRSHTYNLVAGFKAKLGASWELEAYGTHGQSKVDFGASNNKISANATLASDAVRAPNGEIVCRSTLTSPGNGCIPFNSMGEPVLTDAQRAYLLGVSLAASTTKQDVIAASVHGDLLEGWAGPVSVAFGGEYRHASLVQVADPIGQANGFAAGNLKSSSGQYNVKEGFAEIQLPLLKDVPLARQFDLNAAVRVTDYSTSGSVTTWKVGITDELFDGFRVRAALSQDIRAPNITELFAGVTRGITSIRETNGVTTNNIFSFSGSNPNLKPEKAKTLTVGAVYRPAWLPGLGFSVDYYRIRLSGAITQLTPQTIYDQCTLGSTQFCSLITRNSSNVITDVNVVLQNVQRVEVAGIDFEANYTTDVGNGKLTLRGLGTYMERNRQINPGSPVIEQAGGPNQPKWRGNLQVVYANGPFGLSLSERIVGATRRVNLPTTVDQNHVAAIGYTNLNLRYRFDDARLGNPELFVNVNNLFNAEPRIGATNSLSLGFNQVVNSGLYDVLGRYFTVGLRAKY